MRYIGNRSSGRMGAALVAAFAHAGCEVTSAEGPGAIPAQGAVRTMRFSSAEDLLALLRREWPGHDLLVMAAAVADFRPVRQATGKLRRESGPLHLALEPTPDILTALADLTRPDQYVVGFALEHPDELEASAASKLVRKRADAIVANPLDTMDASEVRARLLLADGAWIEPHGGAAISKDAFAAWLCGVVLPRVAARKRLAAGI